TRLRESKIHGAIISFAWRTPLRRIPAQVRCARNDPADRIHLDAVFPAHGADAGTRANALGCSERQAPSHRYASDALASCRSPNRRTLTNTRDRSGNLLRQHRSLAAALPFRSGPRYPSFYPLDQDATLLLGEP